MVTPFDIEGAVVLLTDPLKMLTFLTNWRDAGIDVSDVKAEVIDSDERFDSIVSAALFAGKRVVVDPLFDAKRNWLSGIDLIDNAMSED